MFFREILLHHLAFFKVREANIGKRHGTSSGLGCHSLPLLFKKSFTLNKLMVFALARVEMRNPRNYNSHKSVGKNLQFSIQIPTKNNNLVLWHIPCYAFFTKWKNIIDLPLLVNGMLQCRGVCFYDDIDI
jgi:hypothetical protein